MTLECEEIRFRLDSQEALDVEVFRYAESTWLREQWEHGHLSAETFPEISSQDSVTESSRTDHRQHLEERAERSQRFEYVTPDSNPDLMSDSNNDQEGRKTDSTKLDSDNLAGGRLDHKAMDERELLLRQSLAVHVQEAEARGRTEGIELGLKMGREEALRKIQKERQGVAVQTAELSESFSRASEAYFHQVEQESVKLALAIAARILRREAQSDPLLLTGAVRVALSQLARSTTVRLLVPAQDQSMWEEALSFLPGLSIRPQVIGTTELQLGECVIETEISSADLGVWSQLKSLEKEFFDRVEDRLAVGESGNEAGDSGQINAINRAILDLSPEKLSDDCNQMVQEEKN